MPVFRTTGYHKVRAWFAGSATVAAAWSPIRTVKVVK